MASERFQLPPSSGSFSLLKFRQPSLEELRERALGTALGLADGAKVGGDGAEGGAADADAPKPLGAQSLRPAVAVAVCKRLGRLVTISGRDVNTFDAISGAPLAGAMDVCPAALSVRALPDCISDGLPHQVLALDRTERTAFVGSLGGEIVQLILSESSVQVLRRLGLCHSTELVAMSMLTSWGTGHPHN